VPAESRFDTVREAWYNTGTVVRERTTGTLQAYGRFSEPLGLKRRRKDAMAGGRCAAMGRTTVYRETCMPPVFGKENKARTGI
jgi:hypothetical protein